MTTASDANELARANGTDALREHFDRSVATRQKLDRATRRGAPKPVRFALLAFDQLRPSRALAYCIKGIFPRTGLCVVWGPPKCGKSFWTVDAVLHIALRWRYRDRKVTGGYVVYCAFEGQEGYGKRIEAFRQQHGDEIPAQVPFSLMPGRMDLVKDHQQFIREIEAQLGGERPAVIVLDTLNRSMAGSESSDEDMSKYVQAADALREHFGCLVIIVHHCGIEGTRPRGHTSLTGAVDAQIAVKRDGAGNVVATVEWMKDGPEGDTIVSRLAPVTVGTDDEGDAITTCVVEPAEAEGPAATTPSRRLSDRQRLALDALTECALASDEPAPAGYGLPAGIRVVNADAWRAELLSRGVLDRDAKNPRQDWKRLRHELAARRLIGDRDGIVWRA